MYLKITWIIYWYHWDISEITIVCFHSVRSSTRHEKNRFSRDMQPRKNLEVDRADIPDSKGSTFPRDGLSISVSITTKNGCGWRRFYVMTRFARFLHIKRLNTLYYASWLLLFFISREMTEFWLMVQLFLIPPSPLDNLQNSFANGYLRSWSSKF